MRTANALETVQRRATEKAEFDDPLGSFCVPSAAHHLEKPEAEAKKG
jgi:hypothetical protein